MAKKRKKKTPEERAAERAYEEDLDRRLREMIERYRVLNAEKRAAAEGS
jgi:ribosome modulation factor